MTVFQTIDVRFDGPVATVVLRRPEVRNAFDARMISELTQTFATLDEATDVRVVVLAGAGTVFSGGADVNWMRDSLEFTREQNIADASRMSQMFVSIDQVSKPVVGRVHGAALGGGMGLVSVCDIVVAADNTAFGFTETKLGIIPAVISAYVLPKTGSSWARALYLTGERFDARVAQAIGLVHWVVPEEELDATVQRKVAEIMGSGPRAVSQAKRLIRDVEAAKKSDVALLTAERIADLRSSNEGQEGLRAFLEERRPPWRQEGS